MVKKTGLVRFYLKFIQIYLTIYLQYYLEQRWHYGLPMNHEVTSWHRTPAGYGLSWKPTSIIINQDLILDYIICIYIIFVLYLLFA